METVFQKKKTKKVSNCWNDFLLKSHFQLVKKLKKYIFREKKEQFFKKGGSNLKIHFWLLNKKL